MNNNNEIGGKDREKIDNVQNNMHDHSQNEHKPGMEGKASFPGQQKSGDMHSCSNSSSNTSNTSAGGCGCGSKQSGTGNKMEGQTPGGKVEDRTPGAKPHEQPQYGEKNRNETGYLDPEKGSATGKEHGSTEQK